MSPKDSIIIKGARQNNLQGINIAIPKDKLVVFTGVSGSGKSSLAFDTIYAEGYRRYVENLSSSARFFLGSVKKPKVERIDNLSPAIAIDQRSDGSNPRSTIGTLTDIYNFLRALYGSFGVPHCWQCGKPMEKQDEKQILEALRKKEDGTQVLVLAAWEGNQKDPAGKIAAISQRGYAKVRIDGKVYPVDEARSIPFSEKAEIFVVVDRLILQREKFDQERIIDSLQVASRLGGGRAVVIVDHVEELIFSKHFRCPEGHHLLKELSPKNFSFNSPDGACERCSGLGVVFQADLDKIIPSKKISLSEGAILPWSRSRGRVGGDTLYYQILKELAKKYRFSLSRPVAKIPAKILEKVVYGEGQPIELTIRSAGKTKVVSWNGVAGDLEEKYKSAESNFLRSEIEKFLTKKECPVCAGKRLKKNFLAVKFLDRTIDQLVEMEIDELALWLPTVEGNIGKKVAKGDAKAISGLLKEIIFRLEPLREVGLGYLDLDRSVQTLSGGEYQRARLSTQLYSGLSDVIYVLDEPSVGLHPRDTQKLIVILRRLCEAGNSVIVVEHDSDIIKAADYLVDIGPGAGKEGGKVVFQGPVTQLKKAKTETAQFLFRRKKYTGAKRSPVKNGQLVIKGASENNLKNIDVAIPLSRLVTVTGVSGSGKSSLINDVLAKALRQRIHGSLEDPGRHRSLVFPKELTKVVIVDQSPLGRSPRSNAATYSGIFSHVRKLFAETELAKKRGLTASHFSFNMRGGRCEYCQGEGVTKIEMHLLSDVYADCPYCNGTRYSKKMLDIEYHGATIVQTLEMSVDYAYYFFNSHHLIKEKLEALKKVGLGYLRLGQSATELSGGEAQRVKLATELSRKSTGKTLYILDEPTIGLHFSDVEKLVKVLRGLVSSGSSVIVVEHNKEIIRQSDWVMELGPEGGGAGGKVVFQGTPEKLSKAKTWTGKTLK